METGRRGFLRGMLGVAAVATTQVFAEKQEPEVLQEKFEQVLEGSEFNTVIVLQRRMNERRYPDSISYRAVRNVGPQKLQRGDIVAWEDEDKGYVVLCDPISTVGSQFAGVVSLDNVKANEVTSAYSARAEAQRRQEENSEII